MLNCKLTNGNSTLNEWKDYKTKWKCGFACLHFGGVQAWQHAAHDVWEMRSKMNRQNLILWYILQSYKTNLNNQRQLYKYIKSYHLERLRVTPTQHQNEIVYFNIRQNIKSQTGIIPEILQTNCPPTVEMRTRLDCCIQQLSRSRSYSKFKISKQKIQIINNEPTFAFNNVNLNTQNK